MRRYTTPTLTITVKGVDLTNTSVYVTLAQYEQSVTIENPPMSYDGENTVLEVDMSQIQSGSFQRGNAKIQVNWKDTQGKRDATVIKSVCIGDNLLREVI